MNLLHFRLLNIKDLVGQRLIADCEDVMLVTTKVKADLRSQL